MPPEHQTPSDPHCIERSQHLDQQMRLLWLPGRRMRLAAESYDLGNECRNNGHPALAEGNFRRVQDLFQNVRLTKSKNRQKIFSLVAASHNYLGLLCLDANRPAEARLSFDRAIEIRRELLLLSPQDRENQIYLGGTLCNRGHSLADSDKASALASYNESLAVLRQSEKTCECAYWDEQRNSWWCSQLEAMGNALGLQWVFLAPQFIDNAMRGRDSLEGTAAQQPSS